MLHSILSRRALVGGVTLAALPGFGVATPIASPVATPVSDRFDWTLHAPEAVGMTQNDLDLIRGIIARGIDSMTITGAVTAIARHNKLVWLEAQGNADVGSGTPMATDSLFRMFSSTKPVTAVAVLMAMEEGLLTLDDEVSQHLPGFANLDVAIAPPGFGLTQLAPDLRRRIAEGADHEPLQTPLRIRHLLTHTAGLGTGGIGEAAGPQDAPIPTTLAERVQQVAQLSLDFQPGTTWAYSPLDGFDVLLRIVEVLSGMPAEEFLQKRIFDPLGMTDTVYRLRADQNDRVVSLSFAVGGEWRPAAEILDAASDASGTGSSDESDMAAILSITEWPYPSGSAGLISSAHDFLQFEQMLLNRGTLNGQRLLKPETVDLMASNQVGKLFADAGGPLTSGYGFGLGVRVKTGDNILGGPRVGTFGWGGALGTESWADPAGEFSVVYMVQQPSGRIVDEIQQVLNKV